MSDIQAEDREDRMSRRKIDQAEKSGCMEAFASDVGDSDSSSGRPAWSHAGEIMGV